jgi:hypothetical protein
LCEEEVENEEEVKEENIRRRRQWILFLVVPSKSFTSYCIL